ncbi:hypothetical protein XENOCAPTIV_011321, partial [Xenoophorus captivus]
PGSWRAAGMRRVGGLAVFSRAQSVSGLSRAWWLSGTAGQSVAAGLWTGRSCCSTPDSSKMFDNSHYPFNCFNYDGDGYPSSGTDEEKRICRPAYRRRRNIKTGLQDSGEASFHPVESLGNQRGPSSGRPELDSAFCHLNPERPRSSVQQNHLIPTSNQQGKPESEIKFSIDYILSTPDPPLPGFRSSIVPTGPPAHVLEPQQLNLHFWTL